VIASWSQTFSAMGTQPQLRMKNINLNYQGDIAVVTCTVETSQAGKGPKVKVPKIRKPASGNLLVTNIFVRPPDSDRYSLVSHTSTNDPLGVDPGSRAAAALRETYQDPSRPRNKQRGGGGNIMGGTIQQLLNGAVIRQRGQVCV
jgi:hypothetical protein